MVTVEYTNFGDKDSEFASMIKETNFAFRHRLILNRDNSFFFQENSEPLLCECLPRIRTTSLH